MTIRETLSSHYLLLAEEFNRRGVFGDALACVLMAGRLGRDCLRAHELLHAAASQPVEGKPAVVESELAPLLVSKRKLDRLTCTELSVAQDSLELFANGADPAVAAPPQHDEVTSAAALLKEMEGLKKRIRKENRKKAKQVAEKLERLAVRVRRRTPEQPPADEQLAADGDSSEADPPSDDLSIEHEVHNLGNEFYKIGMFQEATDAYDIALELCPGLLETYFNRGLARVRLQRYEAAWEDLTRVQGLNERLPEAWYTRGLVAEYMEEYDKALADYKRALEVDPKYERARFQMEIAQRKKSGLSSPTTDNSSSRSGGREEGLITDFSVFLLKSTLRFRDVSGCDAAIRVLRMAALYLSGDPVVAEFGGQVPAGIVLWGPKGVGKTRCVQALAGEVGCRVYALPPTVLIDMWAGNSEKNTRRLWEEAAANAPSVIYIDEIDGFLCRRTRHADGDSWYNKMITTVLYLMSQVSDRGARVLLIGATNRISAIDPAFLRPGRFDEVVHVPPPDARALAGTWLIQLEKAEQAAERVDFLAEELCRAVHFDRTRWMDLAMEQDASDGSGIPELARLCEQRKLTGADVVGIIRAVVADRIYGKKVMGIDMGPIRPSDLKDQLLNYEPPQWRSRQDRPGESDDEE